jgi:hypothetical protein
MSRRALTLCFVAAMSLALIVLLPLQLVLGSVGPGGNLRADEAAGTLWHGSLRRVNWHGQPLGDITLKLQPLPLLAGARRVRLLGDTLSLTVVRGRIHGMENGNGSLLFDRLDASSQLSARISMQDASVTFTDRGCRHTGGLIQVMLEFKAASLPAIPLTGRISCTGQSARLTLAPDRAAPPPAIALEATLQIEHDGRYSLQSIVRGADPAVRTVLLAAGFSEGPAGMSRVDAGSLID